MTVYLSKSKPLETMRSLVSMDKATHTHANGQDTQMQTYKHIKLYVA